MNNSDIYTMISLIDDKFIERLYVRRKKAKIRKCIIMFSKTVACFTLAVVVLVAVRYINIYDPFGSPDDTTGGVQDTTTTKENPSLKNFTIENGVLISYIGYETDVVIPDEVESIADYAFVENENADNIRMIRLSGNVKNISPNSFAGLNNFEDLVIDENNTSFIRKDGLVMSSDGSMLIRYERENENTFTIPDSVRFVAAHAVQGTKLEEIDFGKNLEVIGCYAFASNRELKAIYLPDSVKYISKDAFSGCSSAVDGYIPEGAECDPGAFVRVPFYNSLLAGYMCPWEEVKRGLIAPSEAILKSDVYALNSQLDYILATLNGDDSYRPNNDAVFAEAAVNGIVDFPTEIDLPKRISVDKLILTDKGWDGTCGSYDIQLIFPAENYSIIMVAYAYDIVEELYWDDVRFIIAEVYYVDNSVFSDLNSEDNTFGWSAIFDREPSGSGILTLVNKDGNTIRYLWDYCEDEEPTLIYSPDGTRVAVEYKYSYNRYGFCIISLNGDSLLSYPNYYKKYSYDKYGEYVKGSFHWIDENNFEGENEYGKIKINVSKMNTIYDEQENMYENNRYET